MEISGKPKCTSQVMNPYRSVCPGGSTCNFISLFPGVDSNDPLGAVHVMIGLTKALAAAGILPSKELLLIEAISDGSS